MTAKPALLALALACAMPVAAQQSAHVHGFATLDLVVEDGELVIEFSVPADSLVGFENAPSTAAERQAVDDALAKLRDPARLFALPSSAGCELHEVEAERHAEGDDEHDEHEHAEHDGHDDEHAEHEDHDDDGHDEHDGDEHAEHEHDHENKADSASHSEFRAHYHFECDGNAIAEIGLRLFATWPRIEKVRLQALTPTGQTGGNIEGDDPVIRLQ